jgi:hypothetical protein
MWGMTQQRVNRIEMERPGKRDATAEDERKNGVDLIYWMSYSRSLL